MSSANLWLQEVVLGIHRRNGGAEVSLPLGDELMGGRLGLDSLDVAEVMVEVERVHKVSPFEFSPRPRTWGDVLRCLEGG